MQHLLARMAMLSPSFQNKLLILGLGVTSCAVIEAMRRMLAHYRDLAKIPASPDESSYITQAVEDSLKLSTLDKLLDSPNYGIQEITSIIICERALHDENAVDTLLWHITRPDHKERERGIRALILMMNSSTAGLINKPKTYAAVVKSLEYSITDYEHNEYDPEWDNWHFRDIVEQGCLLFIAQLIMKFKYDALEGLVKYRFVERWLAQEPWGGTTEDDRQLNFMDSLSKEARINNVALELFKYPAGRRQMEKVKLLPPAPPKLDTRMTDGESTAGEDFDGMFVVENRRRRDQSDEEEHLRRRHREAMVLNDGTRPLGRGDIFQRER